MKIREVVTMMIAVFVFSGWLLTVITAENERLEGELKQCQQPEIINNNNYNQ